MLSRFLNRSTQANNVVPLSIEWFMSCSSCRRMSSGYFLQIRFTDNNKLMPRHITRSLLERLLLLPLLEEEEEEDEGANNSHTDDDAPNSMLSSRRRFLLLDVAFLCSERLSSSVAFSHSSSTSSKNETTSCCHPVSSSTDISGRTRQRNLIVFWLQLAPLRRCKCNGAISRSLSL